MNGSETKNGFIVQKTGGSSVILHFCDRNGEIETYILDANDAYKLSQQLLEECGSKASSPIVSTYA